MSGSVLYAYLFKISSLLLQQNIATKEVAKVTKKVTIVAKEVDKITKQVTMAAKEVTQVANSTAYCRPRTLRRWVTWI